MSRSLRITLAYLASLTLLPVLGAEVRVAENHRTLNHNCAAGEAIHILGNENTVNLTGPCGLVEIAGNRNTISMASVRQITAPGNDNTVNWGSGSPHITNQGSRNQFHGRGNTMAGNSSGVQVRGNHVQDGAGNSVTTKRDGSSVVKDAAGNTVITNADGSTTIKDAAGNTLSTTPQ